MRSKGRKHHHRGVSKLIEKVTPIVAINSFRDENDLTNRGFSAIFTAVISTGMNPKQEMEPLLKLN